MRILLVVMLLLAGCGSHPLHANQPQNTAENENSSAVSTASHGEEEVAGGEDDAELTPAERRRRAIEDAEGAAVLGEVLSQQFELAVRSPAGNLPLSNPEKAPLIAQHQIVAAEFDAQPGKRYAIDAEFQGSDSVVVIDYVGRGMGWDRHKHHARIVLEPADNGQGAHFFVNVSALHGETARGTLRITEIALMTPAERRELMSGAVRQLSEMYRAQSIGQSPCAGAIRDAYVEIANGTTLSGWYLMDGVNAAVASTLSVGTGSGSFESAPVCQALLPAVASMHPIPQEALPELTPGDVRILVRTGGHIQMVTAHLDAVGSARPNWLDPMLKFLRAATTEMEPALAEAAPAPLATPAPTPAAARPPHHHHLTVLTGSLHGNSTH